MKLCAFTKWRLDETCTNYSTGHRVIYIKEFLRKWWIQGVALTRVFLVKKKEAKVGFEVDYGKT